MDREPPDAPEREPYEPFPEARPFRRIQAATFGLLALAAVFTLLSDSRPAAVRWGAAIGVAALIVAIWLITRHRASRRR